MIHSSHLSAGDETTEQGSVSSLCWHLSCAAQRPNPFPVPSLLSLLVSQMTSHQHQCGLGFSMQPLLGGLTSLRNPEASLTHLRFLLFPPLLCSVFLSLSHCLSPFPLYPYPSLLPFFPYLVFVVKIVYLPHPGCRRAFMWGVDSSSWPQFRALCSTAFCAVYTIMSVSFKTIESCCTVKIEAPKLHI